MNKKTQTYIALDMHKPFPLANIALITYYFENMCLYNFGQRNEWFHVTSCVGHEIIIIFTKF